MVWKTEELINLCIVFDDGDWIESKDQSELGIRLVQTGNVGIGQFLNKEKRARYISEETFKRLNCSEIFAGDCLISRLPDPVGRACIIPDQRQRMITAVDCTIIRFEKSKILPEFFVYYSQSNQYYSKINVQTTGTTRDRISRNKLGKISIPLPPLDEQHRIVEKLDAAFAAIDQAIANTRQNLSNARELFEAELSSIKINKQALGNYINIITGKLDANAAVPDGAYPFFTCSRDVYKIDKFAFDTEAILLAGNNAVGDFNVKHYCGKFNAYQRTYILTINGNNLLMYRFLYYQLLNSLSELKKNSVGANTRFLKLDMIKNLKISIPEISEQKILVDKLDLLYTKVQQLEALYQQKLDNLSELKQSILHKAFQGELT
jgi:type I restriction enzyme S subunit